ncbi:MAG: TsaD/Kae1/Qri7 protein, required for threonylcarbamoyladenosine t(6)A37 formation in tRNA [Brockia lithotrophica]|uniref:tRNA N6-adenosine threonylcarbamoyltransferase n=1 Tax=Brockia lithotrophica TaxID=933949 RepID=A0A2T5GAQ9_9BACL|nr:MAG: TsaD/Kae1/Qri7 protein, required for threonylcarbamoyladenosine t(6)A37 formation in tRNA [Brockia lithotrophica]
MGIETSCDETAVALVDDAFSVRAAFLTSQVERHAAYGGVVPELAAREHLTAILPLLEQVAGGATSLRRRIQAVAVTYGPGLVGALHIGIAAAKALAWSWDVPLLPVHHLAAHIYAARLEGPFRYPFLALLVSGGHTELVFVEGPLTFRLLGGTRDDAVGEAYDKVARLLGLPYPGGPAIDRLAQSGEARFPFPRVVLGGYAFSFSGLKTHVRHFLERAKASGDLPRSEDVAASFQAAVVDVLAEKTFRAVDETGVKELVVAGGVAANSALRRRFSREAEVRGVRLRIPPPAYCTDNAAMVAALGVELLRAGITADLDLPARASLPLDGWPLSDPYLAARARG